MSFRCSRKELLQLSLQQGKYNQKRAAELLGLTYHQFRALLKSTRFSEVEQYNLQDAA